MGTRGTLRVYVNGELKIRQYNQWDSYPTGQFHELCEFMSNPDNVKVLYGKLLHTKFFTRDEVEAITNNKWWAGEDSNTSPYYAADYYFMTARDWGADILPLICMTPARYYRDRMPNGDMCYLKLADWADVFDVSDLEDEEGNYVIEINNHDGDITFLMTGDWHGVKRAYRSETGLPDMEQLTKWEEEANE